MWIAGKCLTYLLFSTLLFFSGQVMVYSARVHFECLLNCTAVTVENCKLCSNTSEACFDVSVQLKAEPETVNEGTELAVVCNHNLPQNLTLGFTWQQNKDVKTSKNNSVLLKIKEKTTLTCIVQSLCGNFSSAAQDININDQSGFILLICGVSAVVVIILLAVAMKIIIKRNQAQNEARKRQRQAHMQNISSTSTTITGYW
ncbi:uncharacterized protein [Salminus brasiliensis]|uniref:uncharacterized protein n=1 Tax=Salminus brasiliensis TaxID=930266 RepID=UPI003B837E29